MSGEKKGESGGIVAPTFAGAVEMGSGKDAGVGCETVAPSILRRAAEIVALGEDLSDALATRFPPATRH